MKQKKKYYLIGILLLIGGIVAYHFYAASEAELQIDKAIQEQAASDSISVQYSDITVSPFGGSIAIRDLTVVLGDHIERARHLQIDISYLDYLNIYIGGIRYGLDHLHRAKITLLQPSYVNQAGLEELKLDELTIHYRGNVLDGLLSAVKGTAFTQAHTIDAKSSGLTVKLPQTTLSKVTADQFQYSGSVSAGQKNFWLNGAHQFSMDSLTWTPSENFQNSYSFFIKGFGYSTNAIPFESADLHTKPAEQDSLLKIESSVNSDLALVSSSGFVQLHNRLGSSELKDMKLSVTKFSDTFKRVLLNIEQLFSIDLPRSESGISLHLQGTLSNPRVAP